MAQSNEQGGEELLREIRKILLRSELTVTEKGSNFSAEGRLLELFEAYRKQHELELLDRLEAGAVENVNGVKVIGMRHINAERERLIK